MLKDIVSVFIIGVLCIYWGFLHLEVDTLGLNLDKLG